jgi:hypothetical protein
MRKKIYTILISFLILSLTAIALVSYAQVQPPSVITINSIKTVKLDDRGNALVTEKIKMSAEAFVRFKEIYNPLSTLVRELEPRNSPIQIENVSLKVDEANNAVTATYKILGAAVYQGNNIWQYRVSEEGSKPTLSSHDGNKFVFTNVLAKGYDYQLMETITVILPENAKNPSYHEDEGVLTYQLQPPGTGSSSNTIKLAGIGLAVIGVVIIAYGFLRKPKLAGRIEPESINGIETRK